MLTEREKFIAHYLSVAIVAAINNQSSSAADRTIDKLRETRTRSITFEEGQKILDELNQEFLLAGSWLNHIRKEKDPNLKFFDKDDALEGLK